MMTKGAASTALFYCAAVGFSEITSANVVGYQLKPVRKLLSQTACTFDQIGIKDGALDIQKLLPVDEEGEYVGDGDITIQFISDRGKLDFAYSYYGAKEYDKSHPDAGWYDEDEDELAEYTFASGEAFQVYGGSACNFQYSGEVVMAETDVPFRKLLSFQANVRPCETDIQSIIPVDGDGEYIGDGDITIQFFSDRGKLSTAYSYYGPKEYDKSHPDAGWYDEDEDELAEYTFAAGEGFKLYAGTAGYLRFPEL